MQNAGLTVEFFHEVPVNCYQAFPGMVKGAGGKRRYSEKQRHLPQTFSLRVRKTSLSPQAERDSALVHMCTMQLISNGKSVETRDPTA